MTTASELFHNRRTRFDRNTNDVGLDSSVDRNFHHYHSRRNTNNNHTNRRDRTEIDNCDPLRRPSNPSRSIHRLSFPERESIRLEQNSSQSTSSNVTDPENFISLRNRQSFSGNDRLPGAVLLARERLLQRLRGVSSSTTRQRSRVSASFNEDDLTFGVSNRVADHEEWDINSRTDWQLASQETRKRPPGLTKEAFRSLHVGIFSNGEETKECSICLESFIVGEKLLCLTCGHTFHSDCLEPWVRTCADCPNCRNNIASASYNNPID